MASRKKLRLTPRGLMFVAAVVLIVIACIILISVYSCAGKEDPVDLTATMEPTLMPSTSATATAPLTPEPVITNTDAPSSTTTGSPDSAPAATTPGTTATPAATLKPALDKEPTSSQKDNAKAGVVNGNDVNLRGGPSTEYVSLGKYNKGDELTIYDTESGFAFVKTKDGKLGYISSQYVSEQAVGDAPSGAVNGKVTASKLALREGPSTDSKVVGELTEGAAVYIYFKTGDFYYVEVASTGDKCYAYASYVKAEDSVPKGTPVP